MKKFIVLTNGEINGLVNDKTVIVDYDDDCPTYICSTDAYQQYLRKNILVQYRDGDEEGPFKYKKPDFTNHTGEGPWIN